MVSTVWIGKRTTISLISATDTVDFLFIQLKVTTGKIENEDYIATKIILLLIELDKEMTKLGEVRRVGGF